MYNNFVNKKINITYNSEGILLSDGHERTKLVKTIDQLFNILDYGLHNFSDQEIFEMKKHMGISLEYVINQIIEKELTFQTSRSGGHGGQNINKVETKVQLFFDIINSKYLDQAQKDKIILNAHHKQLHKDNSTIEFECQETRHQEKNKEIVIKKFKDFIYESLKEEKKRIDIEISQKQKEKRLNNKKHNGNKKENRKFKIDHHI